MKFFCYTPDGFELYETADAAKEAAKAALELWTDGEAVEGYESICWGEVLGRTHTNVLHEHGPECKGPDGCPAEIPLEYDTWAEFTIEDEPQPEVDGLRAELAALRARVGAVLTTLREKEASHRQAVRSLAHGEYSFERAEAYEHAADLLTEALEAPGGEE